MPCGPVPDPRRELGHRAAVAGVLVDQLPVQVLDQGRMQKPVVVGVRYDEGRGQRVGHVQEQPALAGMDLEDPQRLGEPGYGPPRVRRLGARREAVPQRLAGPLLPSCRRPAEVQCEVPLEREVQRQEAEPPLGAPLGVAAPLGHPVDPAYGHAGRRGVAAAARPAVAEAGPVRGGLRARPRPGPRPVGDETVRDVRGVGGAVGQVDRAETAVTPVDLPVQTQPGHRLGPHERYQPYAAPHLRGPDVESRQIDPGHPPAPSPTGSPVPSRNSSTRRSR